MNTWRILVNAILTLLGAIIIFLVTYLFGWDFLSSYLVGNDIGMVQTAASWFDRFFPNIPQWFPLHGSGVSLFQGTQIGASLITVITRRLLLINLVQAIHLWEFLAVYLTALGVFIFVAVKFKSWTAAILAGIFYPLSNASWAWLAEIGLYANAIAFIFYPPALLFFDLFLTEFFDRRRERKLSLWFVLTSVFVSLAILTHFTAGTVLFEAIVVYGFVFSLLSCQKKLKNCLVGLGLTLLVILTAVLLSGFWLFPFLRYTNIASRNLLPVWSFEQIPYITLSALFGFSGIESLSQNNGMWYVFFSRPVWILAVLGIIFAFLRKNKTTIVASFLFIFFVFYAIAPGVTPWLVKTFLIFWRDIYIRSLIPAIIFLPVLAAWGCLALAQGIANFSSRLSQRAINCATPIFALIIAILAIFLFKGAPPNGEYQWPCYQGFGRWWRTAVDYCHFWDKLGKIDLRISSQAAPYEPLIREVFGKLDLSPETRVDISPKQGALIGVWSNLSDTPLLTMYWYPMTLNNNFWGYEQGLFYDRTSIEPPEAIPQLASWFGIKYVLLHKSEDPEIIKENLTDPFEKYTDDFWEEIFYDKERSLLAKRFKNASSLVTWTNQPSILVLGNIKNQAYEQVFRKAANGILPYAKALLIEGRDDGRLDKYSLEELKKFDGIIAYGQVYEDRQKVDKLLSDYVKAGGRLFIESGWQFTNSEWQTHQALEVVPLERLEWNEGEAKTLDLNTDQIGGEFDKEKFGKFIYYNSTWNVTTAPKDEVKNWGKIILERNNKPIIVIGSLGEGRIVWSGMNLFGHLQFYQSREEYNLTQQLFSWLLEGKESRDLNVSFERPNPDRIEFTLGEGSSSLTSLLWRENFYPDWRANLSGKELPIYRAGPNLMLMRLPPAGGGEKVKLEFKLTTIPIISRIISLLTFIVIIILLVAPKKITEVDRFARQIFSRFSKTILEDEEQ